MKNQSKLQDDIARVLNCASAENGSNTPDFILAEYLIGCLNAWNQGVMAREKWYGRPIERDNEPDHLPPLG